MNTTFSNERQNWYDTPWDLADFDNLYQKNIGFNVGSLHMWECLEKGYFKWTACGLPFIYCYKKKKKKEFRREFDALTIYIYIYTQHFSPASTIKISTNLFETLFNPQHYLLYEIKFGFKFINIFNCIWLFFFPKRLF